MWSWPQTWDTCAQRTLLHMHWLFIWRDNEPIKECRCRLHCAKVGVSCARSNACIYLNHPRTHREMRETTWVEQNHIRMKSEDYKPTYETHVLSGFLHGSDTNSYSINVCYIVSTGGCVCVCACVYKTILLNEKFVIFPASFFHVIFVVRIVEFDESSWFLFIDDNGGGDGNGNNKHTLFSTFFK